MCKWMIGSLLALATAVGISWVAIDKEKKRQTHYTSA